ncbi:MAG: acyltransferase [Alphaproteobacteria bacterium]|nr:acyltransferase [Alphaproteobacteria bacterium]
MNASPYRPDIQALRGVAVLMVVLYHAACPWMQGGFIGVDVFFVISGYLMAYSLKNLSADGVLDYYARRARRIVPAYFAAIFLVWVAAVAIALPFETRQYSDKIFYAVTGFPNAGFWMDNSYFAPQLFRPGLHFWSLGVELQFYAILPLIVFLHRKSRIFTAGIFILSLAAGIAMTEISPKTAFFLTPFRIWEFLAGYMIAGFPAPKKSWRGASWLMILALGAFASLKIPVNSFPGLYAIVPAGLSAALIYTGFDFGRFLKPVFRALEKTGAYSYSLYLAHYPVIVFLFYKPFSTGGTVEWLSGKTIIAFIITALLTVLLYHGVEKPLRRKKFKTREAGLAAAAVSAAAILCFVAGPHLSALKYPPQYNKIFAAFFDQGVYRCGKIKRLTDPFAASCSFAEGDETALLVGNSYADSIKSVLIDEARKSGTGFRLMKENCVIGTGSCAVARLEEEIKKTGTKHVILHSSPGAMKPEDIAALVQAGKENGFDVALIDPTPDWEESVPEMLYQSYYNHVPLPVYTLEDYREKNRELLKGIKNIRGLRRYETAGLFCAPDCIMRGGDETPLYFDSGHLTLTGAERLRPLAKRFFGDIRAGLKKP